VTEAERVSQDRRFAVTAVLGITAASWALLMALSPLLQVREIRRRSSSAGVSIRYFWILLIGFALWACYGLASDDLPLVIPNCVALLVTAHTINVVSRYRG
jgi:MtN3 and saliva related transmembrane protein